MPCHFSLAIVGLSTAAVVCQSPQIVKAPSDAEALLAKTKALYDTPFQSGLINFDCSIDFDFSNYIRSNFGEKAEANSPLVPLLARVRYRILVDHSGATVSTQAKLPAFDNLPLAAQMEESDRNLIQTGLNNWIPYAYGEVLPVGPTRYQFTGTASGYDLSMEGEGLSGRLVLDKNLRIVSGIFDGPKHIEMTTSFADTTHGLVLTSSSTDTNHAGVARFRYTYQLVDGYELPDSVEVASDQNKIMLAYRLTECRVQHGIVVHVGAPSPNR